MALSSRSMKTGALFLAWACTCSGFQPYVANSRFLDLCSQLDRTSTGLSANARKKIRRKRVGPSSEVSSEQKPSPDFESIVDSSDPRGEDEFEALQIADSFKDPGKAVLLRPETRQSLRGNEDLLDDISEFRRNQVAPVDPDNNAQLKQIVNVLGTVLSYNFVIIVGFFIWFISGCLMKFVFESEAVIDAFTGLWEVLILPLLSTHMALTFLSAGIEKFAGLDEA